MSYISKYIYDYDHIYYTEKMTYNIMVKHLRTPIPKDRTLNHRIVNIIVFSRIYLNK